MFFIFLRTAQHALCPEAAAAGGVGIADTVFPVLFKQLTVTAVETGGKIKFVELSSEGLIRFAVPDIRQRLLLDIAERAMSDLPADIVHIGIAIVEQGHTGTHLSVCPNEGHAFPDKLTVAGFPQHRLVVEIEIKILLPHKAADALGCFRNIHVKER